MQLPHVNVCVACVALLHFSVPAIATGINPDDGQTCSQPESFSAGVAALDSSLIQRRSDHDRAFAISSRGHTRVYTPDVRKGNKQKAPSEPATKGHQRTQFLYNALIAAGFVAAIVAFYNGSAKDSPSELVASETDVRQHQLKQEQALLLAQEEESKQKSAGGAKPEAEQREHSKQDGEEKQAESVPHSEPAIREPAAEPASCEPAAEPASCEPAAQKMEGVATESPSVSDKAKSGVQEKVKKENKGKKEPKGSKEQKETKEHKTKKSSKSKQATQPIDADGTPESVGKPKKSRPPKESATLLPETGNHSAAAGDPQEQKADLKRIDKQGKAEKAAPPASESADVQGTVAKNGAEQDSNEQEVNEPEPISATTVPEEPPKAAVALGDRLEALRELKELKERQEKQKKLEEERAAAVAALEDVEAQQAKMLEEEQAAEKEFKRLSYKERNRASKAIGEKDWADSSWKARLAAAKEPVEEATPKKKTSGKKKPKPVDIKAATPEIVGQESSTAISASDMGEETKCSPRLSDKASVDESFVFDPLDEAELEEALQEVSEA